MSVGPNPMAVKRLRQDLMDMENDPTPGQWAKPDPANIMKWYYCIKGKSSEIKEEYKPKTCRAKRYSV
jgi:ubiquitin-protein ligase